MGPTGHLHRRTRSCIVGCLFAFCIVWCGTRQVRVKPNCALGMPLRGRAEAPSSVAAGRENQNGTTSRYAVPRTSLEHPRQPQRQLQQQPARGAAAGGGGGRELPSRPLLPHSASAAALLIGLRHKRSGSSSSSGSQTASSTDADSVEDEVGIGDAQAAGGSSLSSITVGSTGLPEAAPSASSSAGAAAWGGADGGVEGQGQAATDGGGGGGDVEAAMHMAAGSSGAARRPDGSIQQQYCGDLRQPPPVLVHSSNGDWAAREVASVAGGAARYWRLARVAVAGAAEGLGQATQDAAAPGAAGGGWGRMPSSTLGSAAPAVLSSPLRAAAVPASHNGEATPAAVLAAGGGAGRWTTPFAGQALQRQLLDQVQPQPHHHQHHQHQHHQQHHQHQHRSRQHQPHRHQQQHQQHQQQQQPQYDEGHSQLREPLLQPSWEPSQPEPPDRQHPSQPTQRHGALGSRQQGPAAAQGRQEQQPRHLLQRRLAHWLGGGKERWAVWRHELCR